MNRRMTEKSTHELNCFMLTSVVSRTSFIVLHNYKGVMTDQKR